MEESDTVVSVHLWKTYDVAHAVGEFSYMATK